MCACVFPCSNRLKGELERETSQLRHELVSSGKSVDRTIDILEHKCVGLWRCLPSVCSRISIYTPSI